MPGPLAWRDDQLVIDVAAVPDPFTNKEQAGIIAQWQKARG